MAHIDPATLKIEPIETAPVQPGEEFGPCLLANDAGFWFVGFSDGERWFYSDDDGAPCEPILWARLPGVEDAARAAEAALSDEAARS